MTADFSTIARDFAPKLWQVLTARLSADLSGDLLPQTAQSPIIAPYSTLPATDNENAQTAWLITLFNHTFAHTHTKLIKGNDEPEYFPAQITPSTAKNSAPTITQKARIVFAHGYFSSGLHEIAHWCIAGKKRRALPDFGYWYTPNRDAATQAQFEQFEVAPQAIECLFTLALKRKFFVAADTFDHDSCAFAQAVFARAERLLFGDERLPSDAQIFLLQLLRHY